MRTKLLLFALFVVCVTVFALPLLAQAPAPAAADAPVLSPETAATITAILHPVLSGLAGKYGWLTQVMLVIATLRLLFKPICEAVHAYVASTDSTDDDKWYDGIVNSKAFKVFAFVLDWGGSIKLTKPQPKQGL